MSNTVKLNTCPKCAAVIPAGAPQGLCPKCVMAGAATATEAGLPPTATSEIPSLERVSTAFPQLEVIELIGRGGMGFVFKARQPSLDRLVALKLLPDKLARDPNFTERFNREGRVLGRLNHANIVSIYDFGQTGGFYFLLMEYVDGVNLRQAMRAGRFSPAEALAIVPKVCEALQYAHEQGVLHRDIKPENILLDAKGRVKIADFGIAKLVDDSPLELTLTGTGTALGTPHYMAPEQLEKPATVDHRADIYSLGVVFYEMLTGELPIGRFAAPSAKTPVNANVDDVVFRTLEKDRERRFQSAGEMKTQVEHLGGGGSTTPAGDSRQRDAVAAALPTPAWVRRLGVLFCVMGASALLPTLLTIGSNERVFHSGMLLALTGVALLARNRWCRGAAIAANIVGLALPLVSVINVLVGSQNGTLPSGWLVGIPGLPNSAGLAVALSVLQTSAFGVALWVLLRRDVNALFAAAPPAEAGQSEPPIIPDAAAVRRPAQALLVVGVLNWLGSILVMLVLGYAGLGEQFPLSPQELGFIALLMILFSSMILLAGMTMLKRQAYPLAILGSVLAMITTPGNIIGLPVGLWALLTLLQPKVRAAFHQQRGTVRRRASGLSIGASAVLVGILVCVIGFVLSRSSNKKTTERLSLSAGRDSLAATNQPAIEVAPMIQFTFTTVDLREEAGTRWLAMDYVEQVKGECERVFRYEASVPGFTAQTRMTAFMTDAKAGFAPVLHQTVSWKLPDSLPPNEAQALRELVAKEWVGKSKIIEPGDERVLFKVVVPGGGSLVTAIGVKPRTTVSGTPQESAIGSTKLIAAGTHRNFAIARIESVPGHPLHQMVARFAGPDISKQTTFTLSALTGPRLVPSPDEDMNIPAEPLEGSILWGTNREPLIASAISFECPGDYALSFVLPDENLAQEAARQMNEALARPLSLVPGQPVQLFNTGQWKGWLETRPFKPEPNRFAFFKHPGLSPALVPGTNRIEAAVATIPPGHELKLVGRIMVNGAYQPEPAFSTTLTSGPNEPGIFWFTWHLLPNPQRTDREPKPNWELRIHDQVGRELLRTETPEGMNILWRKRGVGDEPISVRAGKPIREVFFEKVFMAGDRGPTVLFLEMTMQRSVPGAGILPGATGVRLTPQEIAPRVGIGVIPPLRPSAGSSSNSAAVAPAQPTGFGPEKEVTLTGLFSEGGQLALDRMEEVSLPPGGKQWNRTELLRWLADEGVDLAVFDYGDDNWGLAMRPAARRIDDRTWRNLDAQSFKDPFSSGDIGLEKFDAVDNRMNLYRMWAGSVPLSFAIRTSGGRMAALQILGFTDNPRGVKVRYKLERAASSSQP